MREMKPLITFSIGIEGLAILLLAFGLYKGVGENPGQWLIALGAALAILGGILWNKVIRGLR